MIGSMPSHSSSSAATHHNSQAETDPRIEQKSDIWAADGSRLDDEVLDIVASVPGHEDLDGFVAAFNPPGVRPWDLRPVGLPHSVGDSLPPDRATVPTSQRACA